MSRRAWRRDRSPRLAAKRPRSDRDRAARRSAGTGPMELVPPNQPAWAPEGFAGPSDGRAARRCGGLARRMLRPSAGATLIVAGRDARIVARSITLRAVADCRSGRSNRRDWPAPDVLARLPVGSRKHGGAPGRTPSAAKTRPALSYRPVPPAWQTVSVGPRRLGHAGSRRATRRKGSHRCRRGRGLGRCTRPSASCLPTHGGLRRRPRQKRWGQESASINVLRPCPVPRPSSRPAGLPRPRFAAASGTRVATAPKLESQKTACGCPGMFRGGCAAVSARPPSPSAGRDRLSVRRLRRHCTLDWWCRGLVRGPGGPAVRQRCWRRATDRFATAGGALRAELDSGVGRLALAQHRRPSTASGSWRFVCGRLVADTIAREDRPGGAVAVSLTRWGTGARGHGSRERSDVAVGLPHYRCKQGGLLACYRPRVSRSSLFAMRHGVVSSTAPASPPYGQLLRSRRAVSSTEGRSGEGAFGRRAGFGRASRLVAAASRRAGCQLVQSQPRHSSVRQRSAG